MADEFCLKMPDFHVTFRDLLHAVNLRHGTNGFNSPPKEGVLRMFSAGFEPANLGTKGQHATSRPPKPLSVALSTASEARMSRRNVGLLCEKSCHVRCDNKRNSVFCTTAITIFRFIFNNFLNHSITPPTSSKRRVLLT